jgi:hypothetical protein
VARSSLIRASDADRDAVAERLRIAAVEGRLEPHELEERLHTALRARTYGELDLVLSDLPRRTPAPRQRPGPTATGVVLALAVRLVVLTLVLAALIAAFAVTAAWWILGLVVWLSLRSRRSCAGWHRPPHARRVY